MSTYRVIYQLDDGVWVARIPEVKGCFTQGPTLLEARESIREVLALMAGDQEAVEAELVDDIMVPAPIKEALGQLVAFGLSNADIRFLLERQAG